MNKMQLTIVAASGIMVWGTAMALPNDARRDECAAQAQKLASRLTGSEMLGQLMMDSPAIPRLGIQSYHWWNEALHGDARAGWATVFPQSIGAAATFDPQLWEKVGDAVSTEARAKYNLFQKKGDRRIYRGLTFWSPNVNMFRDPRWGRGQETLGEDPYLSGVMGGAYVRGLQGYDAKYLKTAACAKHYAAHSGPEKLRHGFQAKVSKRDLAEYYLPAFKSLVMDAKVEAVMSAYSGINGRSCTANKWLLTDLLRGEWGFKGHVVSDVGAVGDVCNGHHHVKTTAEGSLAAMEAGLDLCSEGTYSSLKGDAASGKLTTAKMMPALLHLYTTRALLGQFDPPGSTPWDMLGAKDVNTPAHQALAQKVAEESLVLISNKNGTLPLNRDKLNTLAVVGPRALDEEALFGNYCGYAARPVTCMSGFVREAGPAVRVTTEPEVGGCDPTISAVIVCLGITANDEGEEGCSVNNAGGDRSDYKFAPGQMAKLRNFRSRYPNRPLVAVVFGGSPFDLKPVVDICDAVILAWYPGEQGGTAIARVVLGDVNPSGRLPITFPKSYADLPDFKDYSLAGRTYLYANKAPLYPFGYGLSYTKFAYSDLKVETDAGATPDDVKVTVRVRNAGKVAGDEVVQAYVRAPAAANDRRVHHLAGFARVTLAPGEAKDVTIALPKSAFAVYDEEGRAAIPNGASTVFVGGGQPGFADGVSAEFNANCMAVRMSSAARWIFSDFAVPTFDRSVTLAAKPKAATLDLAVAGWYELKINGRAYGDAVMNPPVVAYMKRTPGFKLDVTDFLKQGENRIEVTVAPGWYNCDTKEVWGFDRAPWRAAPTMRAELFADGKSVLVSDTSWQQVKSPVTNVSFRAGEDYDARLEKNAPRKRTFELEYPPRGAIDYNCDANPVRTFEAFEPKETVTLKDGTVRYDFGVNLAGWTEIEVEGEAGAEVILDHDERMKADGTRHGGIACFVKNGVAQRDRYVLAGRAGGESWHPRFVYHGFRYAWVKTVGKVTVKAIRARVVHSDFAEVGGFETDNADFNALLAATRRSYLSNFVGIPTDCPHREKNGWTGDAQLAMETGLWNWDGSKAYRSFLRMMLDTQQANGQVSCILPTAYSFGFGWGSGPAWDALLFEFPWQLLRFNGDRCAYAEAYPAMVSYLGYLESRLHPSGTVAFGLGDWCEADSKKLADRDILVTAISCSFYDKAALFADRLGKAAERDAWKAKAAAMRAAFVKRWGHGKGSVGSDRSSELAVALFYEMIPEAERPACAKRLAERLRANAHKVDFGLIGGKFVPRMLAEYGYGDDAFELFVQKQDPGWQSMLKTGDGSLWEEFDGKDSHNHIMYGDNLAWAYEYLAGIKPLAPGFAKVLVKPCFVKKANRVSAWHQTPYGRLSVKWERKDGKVTLEVVVPEGIKADIALPDGKVVPAKAGANTMKF